LYQPNYEEQAAMGRLYMRVREGFDKDAIVVPFTVFNNYYKVAKPDDFLTHYTGYGAGRDVAKNRNKYEKLMSVVCEKFRPDGEFRKASEDCLGQRTHTLSVSCEKGVTLNENMNWLGKLTLRMVFHRSYLILARDSCGGCEFAHIYRAYLYRAV
tara:strand:+ start:151 stop:615 length:465 start_codon:yes stop_codon:yes gene_type:complete